PLIPTTEADRVLRTYTLAAEAKTAKDRDRLLPKIELLIHSLAQKYRNNTRLQTMIESMTDMVRWCQRTIMLHLNEPFLATLPEHIAICQAVCDRDADRAAVAMQVHLGNMLARIQTYLDAQNRHPDENRGQRPADRRAYTQTRSSVLMARRWSIAG
ncbi:MAG TPA: FCD domain-containing protein, partial [Bradyrhizobium sp.]|nr:FCD domain-containing protein [Bradyrhizobium sp.]